MTFTGTFLTAFNLWMGSGWVLPLRRGETIELRIDKNDRKYIRFTLKVPAGSGEYNYIEIRSWEPAALWIQKNVVKNDWISVIGTLSQDTVELESRTGKPRIRLWTHVVARDVKKAPLRPNELDKKEVPWVKSTT